MPEINRPGESSSSLSEQLSRIDRLEQDVEKLRAVWEKENKGLVGWAKRWGAVLALLVALFAVPRGVVDAYKIFWSRPHTELIGGNSLEMGYDPDGRKVSFTFEFGATNSGSKDDFVKDMNGHLQNISAPGANPLPFGNPDIECSAEGAKMDLPFPIRTASSTHITCTLASQLTQPKAGTFAQSGTYHLVMNVSGLDQLNESLELCFYLEEGIRTELFDSAKLESRKFLYPDCKQAPSP